MKSCSGHRASMVEAPPRPAAARPAMAYPGRTPALLPFRPGPQAKENPEASVVQPQQALTAGDHCPCQAPVSPSISAPPRAICTRTDPTPRKVKHSNTLRCLTFLWPSLPRPSAKEGGWPADGLSSVLPEPVWAAQTTPHPTPLTGQPPSDPAGRMRAGHLASA